MDEARELIEPYCVQDIYADGIGDVQRLGDGVFRTVYFTWARSAGGIYERHVVAKLVRPRSSLLNPMGDLARKIDAQARRSKMLAS